VSLLLPLDESQQIGTVQGEPASMLRSWPQTKVQRCVGKVTVSPLRTGQGTSTSNTVVSPVPGGQGPLLDGSLLDGSLLDDSLDDEDDWSDELLSLELLLEDELLDDELDDEEELEDEELDELLEELDEDELDEELDGSQQPSPRTSTSHLQLSA
jgi:hypothetical protein